MDKQLAITRINEGDPLSQVALAAEKQLFDHYHLDYKIHFVEMKDPNIRLRVLEVGEGQPLLMIPGGSGDACLFAGLMAELKGWKMIAINRPGGGLSDGVDYRKIDVHRLAVNTVKAAADAFGLDRVPIVCNSMGGLWGFWYTLDCPERVSKVVEMGCPALILNTSAPFFMRLLGVPGINRLIAPVMQPTSLDKALEGLRFQGSQKEDIEAMPAALAEAAYHFFRLPTFLNTWVTGASAMLTLSGANPRYQLSADQLKQITVPCLFLWGDHDPFGSLSVADQAAHIIPDAQLHKLRSGHLPFLDKPDVCGQIICDFLSKN